MEDADGRRQRLVEASQQWRRALELVTDADSAAHGKHKAADTSWRSWIEEHLGGVLQDAPAWMSANPACPYLDMVTSLSAVLAKADRAASRATEAHRRQMHRHEQREKRHQKMEAQAKDKLAIVVDTNAAEDKAEQLRTGAKFILGVLRFHVSFEWFVLVCREMR